MSSYRRNKLDRISLRKTIINNNDDGSDNNNSNHEKGNNNNNNNTNNNTDDSVNKNSTGLVGKIISCIQCIKRYRSDFLNITGTRYLKILYLSEIAELCSHVYNLYNVYFCTVPVKITSIYCFILMIDCFFTARYIYLENTPRRRDIIVIVDTAIDVLLGTAFPLIIMSVVYEIAIPLHEMLAIVVIPSASASLRVGDLMDDAIRRRSQKMLVKHELMIASRKTRRRESI